MSVGSEAFLWGILSALSLPMGAVLGILWQPKSKLNSAFMAFGAGALLFALSVELFGHVPHHAKEHGILALLAPVTGALAGGLLFDLLNQALNNQGAFLRSLSNAKRYVGQIKVKRAKELVEELGAIEVFRGLSPEQMALLVQRIKKKSVPAGEILFRQNDVPDDMYFIISGDVNIFRGEDSSREEIATLGAGDTFGEMGILSDQPRTASAEAKSQLYLYTLEQSDVDTILKNAPELKSKLNELARTRADELDMKDKDFDINQWKAETFSHLNQSNMPVTSDDIRMESEHHKGHGGNAAMAIWLGIFIDGIPESLVIGMLAMSTQGMSLAFVAGVFLANLPEAMSSAVSMKKNGMKIPKILWMWGSLTLITGIGAWLGTVIFPPNPTGGLFYIVLGVEGLAAGAMLTMIAETMLPEAFEQGGSVVGLSTLLGFLAALSVAII